MEDPHLRKNLSGWRILDDFGLLLLAFVNSVFVGREWIVWNRRLQTMMLSLLCFLLRFQAALSIVICPHSTESNLPMLKHTRDSDIEEKVFMNHIHAGETNYLSRVELVSRKLIKTDRDQEFEGMKMHARQIYDRFRDLEVNKKFY